MNVQTTSKAIGKNDTKPKPTKTAMNQETIIHQLRQEIRTLNKTIKEMQHKPDLQVVNVMMPRKLLSKANAYVRDTGENVSLSDLICDAVDVYLWGEEENMRMEEER